MVFFLVDRLQTFVDWDSLKGLIVLCEVSIILDFSNAQIVGIGLCHTSSRIMTSSVRHHIFAVVELSPLMSFRTLRVSGSFCMILVIRLPLFFQLFLRCLRLP
jgi:hypothetical protein